MPLWLQPTLRAKQSAMESEGLIQTRDSTAVTIAKTNESMGVRPKVIPLIFHVLRGNKYVANGS